MTNGTRGRMLSADTAHRHFKDAIPDGMTEQRLGSPFAI